MAIPLQVETLIDELHELRPGIDTNDAVRNQALQLTRQLTAQLEDPATVAVNLAFSPFLSVAARITINLGVFDIIAQHDGPITSNELASKTHGEELLLSFVNEVGERTWQANPVTHAMAAKGISAGHRMIGEMMVAAAQSAPRFFQEYGYTCPTEPRDGFMQFAHQTKLTTFELFSSKPAVFNDFNLFMGNTMGARNYWVDWFPVEDQLLQNLNGDSALLVDVGGGKGHDLIAFHDRYPGKGRLVLQDLEPLIASLRDMNPAIEVLPYNFFAEQPIKGAKAYFYHHILHDWSDKYCLQILGNLKGAMKPGYSKLLLHEMLIPEEKASTFHAMLDMAMMAFASGMERTERQWRELLAKAGFELVKVWMPIQVDADAIIEARVNE